MFGELMGEKEGELIPGSAENGLLEESGVKLLECLPPRRNHEQQRVVARCDRPAGWGCGVLVELAGGVLRDQDSGFRLQG